MALRHPLLKNLFGFSDIIHSFTTPNSIVSHDFENPVSHTILFLFFLGAGRIAGQVPGKRVARVLRGKQGEVWDSGYAQFGV
jgi:hypothetical protein